jgi:hypothetical protein
VPMVFVFATVLVFGATLLFGRPLRDRDLAPVAA